MIATSAPRPSVFTPFRLRLFPHGTLSYAWTSRPPRIFVSSISSRLIAFALALGPARDLRFFFAFFHIFSHSYFFSLLCLVVVLASLYIYCLRPWPCCSFFFLVVFASWARRRLS